MAFVRLKSWEQRKAEGADAFSLVQRAGARFAQIKDATVFAFVPPAIPEMGNATGFDFYLQNQGGLTHDEMMAARNQLLSLAGQDPRLFMVRPNGRSEEHTSELQSLMRILYAVFSLK